MRVLITGAGGMVGSHMIDYFISKEHVDVIGTYYKPTVDLTEIPTKAVLHECDVRYFSDVLSVINYYHPDQIFHLAAQSYPTVSLNKPVATIDTNVSGTVHVFEAVLRVKKLLPDYNPVIIVACSSAEYGSSLENCGSPIQEDTVLLPLHPYGVSKVAQDLLAYQYFKNYSLRTIRARIFNTTGPRKINDVCSDFTKRVVMMEKQGNAAISNTLQVGNVETYRAILDVRDLVSALVLLASKGSEGEVYNISAKQVYQIKDIISLIRQNTKIAFTVQEDAKLLRLTDEKIIVGNTVRLEEATGWKPQYTLEETIRGMMQYWRNKLHYIDEKAGTHL